jgi:hypothetical protein
MVNLQGISRELKQKYGIQSSGKASNYNRLVEKTPGKVEKCLRWEKYASSPASLLQSCSSAFRTAAGDRLPGKFVFLRRTDGNRLSLREFLFDLFDRR